VLKGGTLISRVYSERPRFSWDIDLSATIGSKEDYNLGVMNRRMGKDGRIRSIKIGRVAIEFGKFERDWEKDVFVDLLSLKRDMVTASVGAPLPTYLRKKGLKVERLKGEILKLKEDFGLLPFVDSVRATISLAEPPIEAKRRQIKSIVRDALKPVKIAKTSICPPELCLVEKFSRMSKKVDEIGLRDLLCDFYDVGQLLRCPLDRKKLLEFFRDLHSRRKIVGSGILGRRMRENLSVVKMNLGLFRKRREFTWCDYDWNEYFSELRRGVDDILRDLGCSA
jgi:hypothetical protein